MSSITDFNNIIYDKNLSFRAKGVVAFLLSRGSQNCTELEVVANSKDGRDAVRSALKELKSKGYLTTKRIRDDKGLFGACSYVIANPALEEARK